MQSIFNTFNCALENRIWILDLTAGVITNDAVKFFDMLLNEIVNLAIKGLVAVGVCLIHE